MGRWQRGKPTVPLLWRHYLTLSNGDTLWLEYLFTLGKLYSMLLTKFSFVLLSLFYHYD